MTRYSSGKLKLGSEKVMSKFISIELQRIQRVELLKSLGIKSGEKIKLDINDL